MINRVKQKLNSHFTIVPNELLNGSLSPKAVGIFVYLCSKDDKWQFYQTEILEHFNIGKDALASGINELINAKLLLKYQPRTKEGKLLPMSWIIYPTENDLKLPSNALKSTTTGKPKTGKLQTGKPATNNKDNNNKDFNNKNPRAKDYKSSKKILLNLSPEVSTFKDKLTASSHIGECAKDINVELKLETVYIDENRRLYTTSKTSKQLLSSTLNEIWTQLYNGYQINEAKKASHNNISNKLVIKRA